MVVDANNMVANVNVVAAAVNGVKKDPVLCSALMQFICELVEGSTSIQQQVFLITSNINRHVASLYIQGVSKKRYFSYFLSYFSSRGRILLFHMCFGIRILSLFHLAIQKYPFRILTVLKTHART